MLSLINYLSYLELSGFSRDLLGPAAGSLAQWKTWCMERETKPQRLISHVPLNAKQGTWVVEELLFKAVYGMMSLLPNGLHAVGKVWQVECPFCRGWWCKWHDSRLRLRYDALKWKEWDMGRGKKKRMACALFAWARVYLCRCCLAFVCARVCACFLPHSSSLQP